jgi:hypothetical protein
MNRNRLQQDHPCVINYIRRHYLNAPPSHDISLLLDYPEVEDPSDGQPEKILKILKNKVSLLKKNKNHHFSLKYRYGQQPKIFEDHHILQHYHLVISSLCRV